MLTVEKIEEALMVLEPESLKVENHSYKHADHYVGDATGVTHVKISIKSALFEGLSKVQAHQKIYQALDEILKNGLHAIQLDVS